jgi:hypothetical protein
MILLNSDWALYPSAIVDYQTKNKTFLDFVSLMQHMEVKNCLFALALLQPALQGVDPFSPDLTPEQHAMISLECTYNPWYFIREVIRFPPVAGDTPIELRANRANISLWWCFLNHIDYFLIQPRQTGKSVNADGISVWYQLFGTMNTRANLLTKNGDLIKENIARLKKIRKLLPSYLVNIVKADTDNQKEFTNYSKGNRLVAAQAQANEDAARNVGRGLTAPFNQSDEVAFLKFAHISIPVMLAGSGAAREEAARNGIPYGNLFTTTAGKIDTDEGAFAYTMLQEAMSWNEILYDSETTADLYKTVRNSCRTNAMMINGTFSHRQLGYDDDWLRSKIAEARQKGDEARRDYLNQWTVGTLSNPLSTEILEKIRNGVKEPLYIQRYDKEGYLVRWHVDVEEVLRKLKGRQLVMGVDTSNATGRDAITGVILDVSTLEVVGAFSITDSNLQVFSAWLAKFMEEYVNITVIPESKSTWIAILDYLLINLPIRGIDPGRRIYSTLVDRKEDSDRDRAEYNEYIRNVSGVNRYTQWRRYFGFPTNGPLRELLFNTVIQEAGKKTASLVRDNELAVEISGLVSKNGRIDHSSGRHDDHVISWLMVHWFLTYGKNLEHYGIDPVNVKRKVYETEHQLSWKDQQARTRQENWRLELDEVLEKLTGRCSDFEVMKLEHRVEALYRKIDADDFHTEYGSIDALLQNANEKRSRTRSMNQSKREGFTETIDTRKILSGKHRSNRNVVVC